MAYGNQQEFNYREDCTSLVEISISCKGLVKKDLLSKSDPFCVLSLQEGRSYRELGRTETIKDNQNPVFQKTIITRYYFEEEQIVKFTVEDYDGPKKSDLQGSVIIRLAEIASTGESATYDLKCKGKPAGKITLKAEEQPESKQKARFQILCKNVDKKDFWGKSDPYLEIHKTRETGRPILVHITEVIKNTLNPSWKPFEIDLTALCSGDLSLPISFTVYDWDSSGKPDLIGSFRTSFKEIHPLAGGKKEFFLINEEIKRKKGSTYKHSGLFVFSDIKLVQTDTFLDHLKGGLQISLITAVDFTGSNGNPSDPRSLHYISAKDNEYIEAIKSVGSVLAPYDSDGLIPAFGFGAKLPPNYDVPFHCFNLNGQNNPDVQGVDGMLAAYRQTLNVARLSGPTLFSEILQYTVSQTQSQLDNYAYTILLIITDGVINDMRQTVDLIVESSSLPLSIVIVGVGGADFTNMHTLDADDRPLVHSRTNKSMYRDIVQFVPLRAVKQGKTNFTLSKEVLAEMPGQIMKYMSMKGVEPRPPAPRSFKLQTLHSFSSVAEDQGGYQQGSVYPGQPPYPGTPEQQPYPYPGGAPQAPYMGAPPQGQAPYPGQPQYSGVPYPIPTTGQAPYMGAPPGGYPPYSGQPAYPGAPQMPGQPPYPGGPPPPGPNFSDMNLLTGSRDAILKASAPPPEKP
ncbi:Copine-9-like [Oopsacas minuta]|uniref:Copine-9-like n=1 Tax=Oopsacas minuta TaxID=111878 RepID=A0AAV7KR74_9METZ|nr:Copine-9-like [Oopsacas minuta]